MTLDILFCEILWLNSSQRQYLTKKECPES
jgi:hypothetical protein